MKAYVHKDGQQYGPFTVEQLRQYVRQGNFTTGDHACHDGQNWVTIAQVPGFAEATQPAAAPSPTATRQNQVVRKRSVARQPASANAADSQPNKKKIILWSSMGGVATLLVAGLLIWLLGGDETVQDAQEKEAQTEATEANEEPKIVVDRDQLEKRDDLHYFEDKPFSGVAVEKYENGQKESEGTFKDGKLHGLATAWWPNGQKKVEGTNTDGRLHGLATYWYENGQKKSEATFNRLGGLISEKKWDEDGTRLADGQPQEEGDETPGEAEATEANEEPMVVVNFYQLQWRDSLACFEGKPFSGIVVKKSSTGGEVKTIFKDGKLADWIPLSAALLDQEVTVPRKQDQSCWYCGKDCQNFFGLMAHIKVCPKAPEETEAVPTEPREELPGHYGYVNSVTFSSDGKWIVSGSYDGTIRIWDAENETQIRKLQEKEGYYNTVAISPDSKRIFSGSDDRKVKIWDAESGKLLKSLPGHTGEVFSVALDANASRIVSGSGDGTIKIWNAESGEEIRTLKGHRDDVKSVAFSPDGKRVVAGSDDKTAKVWDAESGQLLKTFEGHTSTVESVAFIHGGKRVFSTGLDDRIKIWDAESGEVLKDFKAAGFLVGCAALSPDEKRIVYGCGSSDVVVMDAESGKVLKRINEHELSVMSVAISPDGKRIVSGSSDQTFRIWEMDGKPGED